MKRWQSDYPNASYVRDRYEAEKSHEECKASLDQLRMSKKTHEEEKIKGKKQLDDTRDKIKKVERIII